MTAIGELKAYAAFALIVLAAIAFANASRIVCKAFMDRREKKEEDGK